MALFNSTKIADNRVQCEGTKNSSGLHCGRILIAGHSFQDEGPLPSVRHFQKFPINLLNTALRVLFWKRWHGQDPGRLDPTHPDANSNPNT